MTTHKICYWDEVAQAQAERDATQAEADEIDALKAAAPAAIRISQWEAIKAKRSAVKDGGAKVGTKWFQTDSDSRIQYLGLKDKARDAMMAGGTSTTILYQLGQPIMWKTYDNSFVQVTVQLAIDIVAAVSDLDAGSFAKAEQHRMAMMTAVDPAAYDFSFGWPATYPG